LECHAQLVSHLSVGLIDNFTILGLEEEMLHHSSHVRLIR